LGEGKPNVNIRYTWNDDTDENSMHVEISSYNNHGELMIKTFNVSDMEEINEK